MSTIEVGGALSASEVTEQHVSRQAKKPAMAKQRQERRAKSNDVNQVDRGHGPSLKQQAAKSYEVDRSAPTRWRRAYALPSFDDPPGYSYCWIARHRRRHGDDVGLMASLREGWRFVLPSDIDEEDLPTETFTGRLMKYGEVIGDETTVLMVMSNELKAQRDASYNRKRDAATKAVTKRRPGLAEANPTMPLVEDRNELSVEHPRMRARRRDGQAAEPAE